MQNITLYTGIAATLATLVFIGAYHTSLRSILTAVFAPARDAVRDGHDFVRTARVRLGAAADRIRAEHHMAGPGRVGSAVVGGLLFATLFVVLALTEAALNGAGLAAIFGQPMADLVHDLAAAIGMNSNDLAGALAFSIAGQGLLWCVLWTDMRGWTHLLPLGFFNAGEQRWLRVLLYGVLGGLGLVVLSLAVFRMPVLIGSDAQQPVALMEPSADWSLAPGLLPGEEQASAPVGTIIELPGGEIYTPMQKVAAGVVNILLNMTLVVSVFVCGAIALPLLVILIQLLSCYLMQAALAVPQVLLNLLTRGVEWLFALFFAAFALVARVGTLLAAPLGLVPSLQQRLDIRQPVVPDQATGSADSVPAEAPSANRTREEPGGEELEPAMYLETPSSAPQADKNWRPYDRAE